MGETRAGIAWFMKTFGERVRAAAKGTPITPALVAAIATQETFEVWGPLYDRPGTSTDRLLELCVGDTIDAPTRKAFPRDKTALLKHPKGAALFSVARAALADVATVNDAYRRLYAAKPDKFCHGFGIFQYDLQFARASSDRAEDSAFFVERRWRDFDECLSRFLGELAEARQAAGYGHQATLTHDQLVFTAIAYNHGSVDPAKGFQQGFKEKNGPWYGEAVDRFLTIAESLD